MARSSRQRRHPALAAAALAFGAIAMAGCHQDMWDQPRFKTHAYNASFENHSAARMPVEGAIAYEGARRPWVHALYAENTDSASVPPNADDRFWTGKQGDALAADNYFKVNAALLARGKERYQITCMPCHGHLGDGQGLVTLRGFPAPTTYHIDRLREVEDGYIFDVITRGFGRMYSYAARVAPEDRWAIAAYIRALQFSQNATLAALDPAGREAILHPKQPEAAPAHGADSHAH